MDSCKWVYTGVPLKGSFKGLYRAFWAFRGLGVVISGLISSRIWLISIVTLPIAPFITTHEPPSRV